MYQSVESMCNAVRSLVPPTSTGLTLLCSLNSPCSLGSILKNHSCLAHRLCRRVRCSLPFSHQAAKSHRILHFFFFIRWFVKKKNMEWMYRRNGIPINSSIQIYCKPNHQRKVWRSQYRRTSTIKTASAELYAIWRFRFATKCTYCYHNI